MDKLSKKALKERYKARECVGGIYCIKCSGNNEIWLRATTDIQGAKNRFEFSVYVNSSTEMCMMESWKMYGAETFSFELLEEIKKKEVQTEKEFSDDVNVLLELWSEKLNT